MRGYEDSRRDVLSPTQYPMLKGSPAELAGWLFVEVFLG